MRNVGRRLDLSLLRLLLMFAAIPWIAGCGEDVQPEGDWIQLKDGSYISCPGGVGMESESAVCHLADGSSVTYDASEVMMLGAAKSSPTR